MINRTFSPWLALRRSIGLALLLAAAMPAPGADFVFAAFGDTPYTEEEEPQFVAMIAAINREQPAFSIHVGDFKSGWSPCSDALFKQRAEWFALFHAPLIYTPGDNEWSDCWRAWGASHDPLERLRQLRKLFFADPFSLGQHKLPLTRQNTRGAAYPEHARWTHEGVVFATFNVPGGDNNSRMPGEMAARNQAVGLWLRDTFKLARNESRRAVVLIFQANPLGGNDKPRRHFEEIMQLITAETLKFPGEVMLIHGDTHRYRVDQPLTDPQTNRPLRNFTRLEVFGYPFVNWVRVRVTQINGKVTFTPTPGS